MPTMYILQENPHDDSFYDPFCKGKTCLTSLVEKKR